MIITVTCNPAIDKTIVNNQTVFDIGGKGINVSKVLKELKIDTLATGLLGKNNGQLVVDDLNKHNIDNHFIEVNGNVRTNTKEIINNELIEHNEDGPLISEDDVNRLFEYLSNFSNDIVVISGSAPSSVEPHVYMKMIELLKEKNNYVILDASNDLLRYGVQAKPNIIKPNKDEACSLFEIEYDENTIIDKCKNLGIDLVCVSMGKDGAIFIGNDVVKCRTPQTKICSSVGAGDAMVAALVYAKVKNLDTQEMIRMVMATASAACETLGTKPPTLNSINVKKNDVVFR